MSQSGLRISGWWFVFAVTAALHGWLTLGLFGAPLRGAGLTDDRPIVSGRHVLHLYHGFLGAQALADRGRTLCYDPANYAGYPKTPWLDAGSRPAEVALWLGGAARSAAGRAATGEVPRSVRLSSRSAAAYKIGVAIVWWFLPLLAALSAIALRWGLPSACGAMWLAIALCWSRLGQDCLLAGELDLVLAAGLTVLHGAFLAAYCARGRLPRVSRDAMNTVASSEPRHGTLAWFGMLASGWALVFAQTLLAFIPLCLALMSCLSRARRGLWWYLGLAASLLVILAGNTWWLQDAIRYWWIQADTPGSAGLLTVLARMFGKWCLCTLILTGALLLARGVVLVAGWLAMRPAFRGGSCLPFLGARRRDPAAAAGESPVWRWATMVGSLTPGALFLWLGWSGGAWRLPLGLPQEVSATIAAVRDQTTPVARILWEESLGTDAWTPLLPPLAERLFVGGLGQSAAIEHAAERMREGRLAGRLLALWTDSELADYCRRYNIGWVACQTQVAADRLAQWAGATSLGTLPNGAAWFAIRRDPSFFLVGQGKVAHCDARALVLTDVEPANGQVVVSFHYPPHVWAASQWVRLERDPQVNDAIPFLRLRLAEPMTRVTLYWNGD